MNIRVLVVDDQELVRAGFVMVVDRQSDLDVVGQAGDGVEAVELVRTLKPDVVLMDLRMPKMDGIEATRQITALPTAQITRISPSRRSTTMSPSTRRCRREPAASS